jgi:hypothetical protein
MAAGNTLPYCDTSTITAVKSFKVQAPRVKVIKVFTIAIVPDK